MSKGTAFALECAKALAKPHIVIALDASDAKDLVAGFLGEGQGPFAVCIGGPRESEAPGIHAKARDFLRGVLSRA